MSDCIDNNPQRRYYKFIGRFGNRYYWAWAEPIPGDIRVHYVYCTVKWFWNHRGEA